jgi:hypothetical protein
MSFDFQMWFPFLTIVLTAAIYLSVVSFIMGQSKPGVMCAQQNWVHTRILRAAGSESQTALLNV